MDIDAVSSRIAFAVAATINSFGDPTIEDMKQAVAFVLEEADLVDRAATSELTDKVRSLQAECTRLTANNAFLAKKLDQVLNAVNDGSQS